MVSGYALRCPPGAAGLDAGLGATAIFRQITPGTMTRAEKAPPVALGFRVKSGWAAACLVSGPASSPKVVDRRVVTLSDPEVPRSKQPYHSGTGFAETDAARLAHLVQSVEKYARQSLAALFAQYRAEGRAPVRVGIVVGTDGDPERIGHQQLQAHARGGGGSPRGSWAAAKPP